MRINSNFVTVVRLANDERRLIHNLRVEKHYRFPKELRKCFEINEHI